MQYIAIENDRVATRAPTHRALIIIVTSFKKSESIYKYYNLKSSGRAGFARLINKIIVCNITAASTKKSWQAHRVPGVS